MKSPSINIFGGFRYDECALETNDPNDTIQILAKQAIGVFDSGSRGTVTAAWITKPLEDGLSSISVTFFGNTAHLPHGTWTTVTKRSDTISKIYLALPGRRDCMQLACTFRLYEIRETATRVGGCIGS